MCILNFRKNKWAQIVQQIAIFDCLLSLVLYAQHSSQKMCFPEFVFNSDEVFPFNFNLINTNLLIFSHFWKLNAAIIHHWWT